MMLGLKSAAMKGRLLRTVRALEAEHARCERKQQRAAAALASAANDLAVARERLRAWSQVEEGSK